ncbi:MAG: DUF308 domain-containing protein [Halioglobus sp.]
MTTLPISKQALERFGPYSFFFGIVLIVVGSAGVILPGLMSVGVEALITWLLLIAGISWAVHTAKYSPGNIMEWLKPALLLVTGAVMLIYPVPGVEGVGMVLAIYLLLDALHSVAKARAIYPERGWGIMAVNSAMSAILAGLFLVGWPQTSLWLVGLYIGISLVFDGWALLFIGWKLRNA